MITNKAGVTYCTISQIIGLGKPQQHAGTRMCAGIAASSLKFQGFSLFHQRFNTTWNVYGVNSTQLHIFVFSGYRVSEGLTTLTNCMNATTSESFWLLFMKAAKTAQQLCENRRESPFCDKPKELLQFMKFADFLKTSSVSFDPLRKMQE